MSTQAQQFVDSCAADLMTALDIEATRPVPDYEIEIDQDWDAETVTYTFSDGSSIVFNSSDFEVR